MGSINISYRRTRYANARERLEFHCFYMVSVSIAYIMVPIAYCSRAIAFAQRMCL